MGANTFFEKHVRSPTKTGMAAVGESFTSIGLAAATPTVSGGVADVSALFSCAPSVPKPTPTGKLNNAELESSIMAVAGSGGGRCRRRRREP